MGKDVAEQIKENIINVDYSDVMEKSYIDYAMSVITARALPDVRDGLKPVQRRVVYDMYELGITSDKPCRKSARIVGDTLGKYHPHGDSSCYGAEVIMAQDFKYRMPLIDGQGNFGSIEGDGAAAMRYTECKLQKYTEKVLLDDLKNNTVDFIDNYDATEREPIVFPAKIPNLLVNGSEGIAVGVATNIPPHNVNDVIDTTVHYIDNPNATTEELVGILKGPDFPTGGIVSNKSDLVSFYESGIGKIKIRGKIEVEDIGKGKKNLVITEIPYTMVGDGTSKFLQSIASLVEDQTLDGVADILNETSKDGVRIVIELKKSADVDYIKNVLYKKAKLEDTFGMQTVVINKGKPEVMGLKDILNTFMEFQYEIYTRKYTHKLDKLTKRKNILEGLVKATDVIAEIIETVRFAPNIATAKNCLMTGETKGIKFLTDGFEETAKTFDFSEEHADSIIAMRLSQLNRLEINKLQKELKDIMKEIAFCEKVLGSRVVMRHEIKKVMLALKEELSTERKTEIIEAEPIVIKEREIKEENTAVLIDRFGYIHAVDRNLYEKNKEYIEENFKYVIFSTNKRKLLIFTDIGKVHTLKATEIPYTRVKDKGQPLDNICGYDSRVENILYITDYPPEEERELIFLSSDGFVKRVNLNEFDVSRKTIDASKLNDSQTIAGVFNFEDGQMVVGTKDGYFIRFDTKLIPQKKKLAVGVSSIKLQENDYVNYCITVKNGAEEISIHDNIVPASRIKQSSRGAKGVKIRL